MTGRSKKVRPVFLGIFLIFGVFVAGIGCLAGEVFDVRTFGAKGDGKADDTAAIQAAINACFEAGGGTVYNGAGQYLCTSLRLKSHLRLFLDAGATLVSIPDESAYAGLARCLLVASDAEDITVEGPGGMRGTGSGPLGRLADGSDLPIPAFRLGILRFENCKNVVLRGFKVFDSDSWTIHLRFCENVLVDGLTILNHYYHTNSDGIDPVSCRNVRIANCHIVAGDDCIVLKTADRRPCESVVVTNCTLETVATAVKLGTESSGDFRNVHVANCSIRNSTVGIGLYMKDGGTMERISFSQIDIENPVPRGLTNVERSMFPIFVDIERRSPDSAIGRIRDLTFSDITITSGVGALIQGMPESPIENLVLRNITFRVREPVDQSKRRKHIGGRRTTSDARDTQFSTLPSYFTVAYARHIHVGGLRVFIDQDSFKAFPRAAFHAAFVEGCWLQDILREPDEAEALPRVIFRECTGVKFAE